MAHNKVTLLFLAFLLSACGWACQPASPDGIAAGPANTLPAPSPTIDTPTPLPPATAIPPELGGSQAMIQQTFERLGVQFNAPSADGTQTYLAGQLTMEKGNGDPFDMIILIGTIRTGDSLTRASIRILVPGPLTESETAFVLGLLRSLWTTSMPEWAGGAGWIDATLPGLQSLPGQQARTSSGPLQAKMNVGPWLSNGPDGLGYGLTLWVDPIPLTTGEAIHISVEAITPLQDGDSLTLSCSDYEDPGTVTWSVSPVCVPSCPTGNPNVIVSNTKITVYEGFPVTWDQWAIKVELDTWGNARYPPNTFHLEVVFHGRTYSCTNSRAFNWNENMGEAVFEVMLKDGEPYLFTDDPVGMVCAEE